jgi:hypothetical protein
MGRQAVRLTEHQQHIHLEHPDKSAMAELSINLGHCIQLHHAAIFSAKPRHMDRIREAIELHPKNMNKKDDFYLSKSWKPLICSLKDHTKPSSHESRCGFSAGPPRSVHTALMRAQNVRSLGTHQPPPWCPSFLPQPLLPHPPPHACGSLISRRYPTKHTPTLFPSLFPKPAELPLFRAILNSCSWLLLVHFLVMRAQWFHSVSQRANVTCFHAG